MIKKLVKAVAAIEVARRLFTLKSKTASREALAPRGDVEPTKQEQSSKPTPSATQQRRREAIATPKRVRRQLRHPLSTGRKYAKGLIAAFVVFVGLFGSAVGIDAYVASRIDVSSVGTSDQSNPFSTLFEVTNEGNLTLHEVTAACYVRNAATPEIHVGNVLIDEAHADKIIPMDKSTVRCSIPVGGEWLFVGEIYIIIRYRPLYYWWEKDSVARFVGVRRADGTYQWVRRPSAENARIIEEYEKLKEVGKRAKSGDWTK